MLNYLRKIKDYYLIKQSGFFDEAYYCLQYPDVRRADVNPLWHFVNIGWKEGRNPSACFETSFYLQNYADVKESGVNPLFHYLKFGLREGRIALKPSDDTLYLLDNRDTLKENVHHFVPNVGAGTSNIKLNLAELAGSPRTGGENDFIADQTLKINTKPEFIKSDGSIESILEKTHDTAVVLHVYYSEVFIEITSYLKNLEDDFDLYVSVPKSRPDLSKLIFSWFPKARIILVENRGRDIAPFLEIYKAIQQLNYCCILKLHTKISPHRTDGESWRKDIYSKLIGSKKAINNIKNVLVNDHRIGIIAPQGHVLDGVTYIGGNEEVIRGLAIRAGFLYQETSPFIFVAGSMFWVNPDAIKMLAELNIKSDEFEPEPIDPDGTFVHGLERFIGLSIQETGYSLGEIDRDGHIRPAIANDNYQYAPRGDGKYTKNNLQPKTIVFYSSYKENFAIEHLRIIAPLKQAGYRIIDGVVNGEVVVDSVLLGDSVFFQREFPGNLDAYRKIVKLARKSNKTIVYDLDDLLFDLPENHPEFLRKTYTSSLLPMLQAVIDADYVTVSSKKIKDMLVGFNNNVIVLPNFLDDNIWSLRTPSLANRNDKLITIGYMGSYSHKPDLELITPVLLELIKKYSNKIRIQFWGIEPPEQLRTHPEVYWTLSLSNNYLHFVKEFQQQHADIFIAPLANNKFNSCKSPLKFYEYSALGAPGVYSRFYPYTQVITHGVDGFLASSNTEWFGYLEQLIEDEILRKTIAENAQANVRSNWLLSKNKELLCKIYEKVTSPDNIDLSTKNNASYLITTIKNQLDQNAKLTSHDLLIAQNQVHSLVDELNSRKDELHEIHLSKSWKLAMLFRSLSVHIVQLLSIPRNLRNSIVNRFTTIIVKLNQRKVIIKYSKLIEKSTYFDRDWYLRTYPDVAAAKIDPLRHYVIHGGFEKRDPSPAFCSEWYFESNPDVKISGMNPLIHYLLFGQSESRLPKALTKYPTKPLDNNPVQLTLVMNSNELAEKIEKSIKHKRYIISLSHDSYLEVTTGGVQAAIADEQKSCNIDAISYLHIYPYLFSEFLLIEPSSQLIGINLDGEYLGVCEIDNLISAIHKIDFIELEDLHIHHTMGFNIGTINKILELNNHDAKFWLHDYFSVCPSYHLLRNGIEYCGAPDMDSNACSICKYVKTRKMQTPVFTELYKNNRFRIIAPSRFTLNFWQNKVTFKYKSVEVAPLISLDWLKNLPLQNSTSQIRIGFLGYPLEQKGWGTWAKLIGRLGEDDRFTFYHFSTMVGSPGNYKRIFTKVSPENRNSMIENLNHYEIDVAFLWSQVPETFSFTLYEALAAGCYIITSNKSGNIQDFISQNPQHGIILKDETELYDLFSGNDLSDMVKNYQKNGKPQAKILPQSIRSKE